MKIKISTFLIGVSLVYFIGIISSVTGNMNTRIIELNNKFIDYKKDGYWLVMFYAPWCVYCKRLDPIWSHVQQTLHDTGIRVCRIDCTTFSKACRHFGVNGYPTVMFIKADEAIFTFKGERTRNEIVHFALRVASPPVKHLREDSDKNIKDDDLIFFVYVGETSGRLWDAYEYAAVKYQPFSYFFYAPSAIAEKYFKEVKPSTVFVRKENQHYSFNENEWDGDLNISLSQWVNAERFPTFLKVTYMNMNIILESNKFLVLVVVEENKIQQVPDHMLEFRDMVESVIKTYRDRFHRNFQFGWTGEPNLANSIAMKQLPVPFLLVVNSSTHHHHIPEDEPHQLTPEAITLFLDSIQNQSAKVYGGNTLLYRIYSKYFEVTTSLAQMWRGNPVLTTLIFGLPCGFLSLICYSICCADILDAKDDEADEDPVHEKNE